MALIFFPIFFNEKLKDVLILKPANHDYHTLKSCSEKLTAIPDGNMLHADRAMGL